MGELKRIRVRKATTRDIGLFRKLWASLLEQNAKDGSVVLPTDQSIRLYESLFNMYVEQSTEGVVFLVADRGIAMVAKDTSGLEYRDKTAVLWGLHSSGDDRIQQALLDSVEEWVLANDMAGLVMQSGPKTEPLEGFEPAGTIRYRTLTGG